MASSAAHVRPEHAHTAHKRHVNQLIFESLSGYSKDGEIAFFCECSSERCFDTVWMGIGEYERSRLNPRWSVVRSGHRRPASPSQAARETHLEVLA